MTNEVQLQKVETLAVWEAPTVTEYDAKAEIQGAGFGPNEPAFLAS